MTRATHRRITLAGPDSANLVDVRLGGDLVLRALSILELRDLAELTRAALAEHPLADYVEDPQRPDGRLYCPECAEGGRPEECEGPLCYAWPTTRRAVFAERLTRARVDELPVAVAFLGAGRISRAQVVGVTADSATLLTLADTPTTPAAYDLGAVRDVEILEDDETAEVGR